jgi:hypothetical protein
MRFQRHADAQPNIPIIGIDAPKGIADALVVVSLRLPSGMVYFHRFFRRR